MTIQWFIDKKFQGQTSLPSKFKTSKIYAKIHVWTNHL